MAAIIHPISKRALDAVFASLPQAVIIAGPEGVGLSTIVKEYLRHSNKVLQVVLPVRNETIDIDKGTITVELIRDLYSATKTREPKGKVVLIDYAERMATSAQNAFLKLLEEPPEQTHFILLTHTPELLLRTIRSRSQMVEVRPVSAEQSQRILDSLKVTDATRRAQLIFIANGLPAELCRLVNDDARFQRRISLVKDARTFIQGTPYERLRISQIYKDDREAALILLADAMRQLRQAATLRDDTATIKMVQSFQHAHQRIYEQGNVRLQLASAALTR